MDRESIKEVLRDVFGRSVYTKDLGQWVSVKCPLAPWTHERGHDKLPSAGITVNNEDVSIFNCYACKVKGPFSYMLSRYAEYSGEDLDDLIREVSSGEFLGSRTVRSYEEARAQQMREELIPLNEGIYMDLYESAVGLRYLRGRGISKATTKKLELLLDPSDSDGEPRVLFPVRGPDGLLYGFSGRALFEDAELKVRDYYGLKKSQCVLGSHFADNCKTVIAVEGLFDYARIHELGECGCAVMHSTLTEYQADIFRGIGKPVVLLYDNDKAGKEGVNIAARQLRGFIPVFKTEYPKIRIADNSERGWHWLKDPGEMELEDLQYVLGRMDMV